MGLVDDLEGGVVGVYGEQFLANTSILIINFLGLQIHDMAIECLELLCLRSELIVVIWLSRYFVHFG